MVGMVIPVVLMLTATQVDQEEVVGHYQEIQIQGELETLQVHPLVKEIMVEQLKEMHLLMEEVVVVELVLQVQLEIAVVEEMAVMVQLHQYQAHQ